MNIEIDQLAFKWLNENQLSYDIWDKKYRWNNESFEEWLNRVSGNDEKIKQLIYDKKFLFGGRTLSNRGTGNGSLNNCYSSGYVGDHLEDIMQVNKDIALTFKAEGGQGISLSKIRPKGSLIKDRFETEGIVPFMEMFNKTTESIMQGSSRRGALMMSLDIWHKEAEEFIKIKSDLNKINKANLSLEIDDYFMSLVKSYYNNEIKEDYVETLEVELASGQVIEYDVQPIKLYKTLCEHACKYAEPGVLFVNRLRNYNMMELVDSFQIETTNPCGEQPLPKHGACGLCSINLSEYVINPFDNENVHVDYDSLKNDIYYVVKAMDEIVDENLPFHALKEQRDVATKFRNLGIGVMGLHDMMIKMGMVYGSDRSIAFVQDIMRYIFKYAILASSRLANEKGTFPGYDPNMLNSVIFTQILWTPKELEYIKANGLRNSTLLSIAPTGSIGTMLNISTGIEPWYAFSYFRNTKSLGNKEESYEVLAPIAKSAKEKGYDNTLVTSKDISWRQHIDIQAAAQVYVDTAISKTINMPKGTTPEEVEQVYLYAWEKGLKGCTIYVDGSRDPILSTSKETKVQNGPVVKRPKDLDADFYLVKAKGELFIVLVGLLNDKPYEVFTFRPSGINNINIPTHRGKITKVKKMHYKFESEYITINDLQLEYDNIEEKAATLYTSMLLRHNAELKYIIKTAKKVNENITSFTSAMCRVLSKYVPAEVVKGEVCPECGGEIIRESGCCKCNNCGWSKCG